MSNILRVNTSFEEVEMMDITVEDVHCFYAGGILTHNCNEEMRIVANLSQERVWADAINSGEDLHSATCVSVFGKLTKEGRAKAKTINFGVIYGMSEYTLAERLKCSIAEARATLKKYHQRLPNLTKWMNYLVKKARKSYTTQTYYGRVRTLEKYYNCSDPGLRAFADRSVVNTAAQGCIPESISFELNGLAVKVHTGVSQTYKQYDKTDLVISHRGDDYCFYVESRSHEAAIVSINHIFFEEIRKDGEWRLKSLNAIETALSGQQVVLSPLQKKTKPDWKYTTIKSPLKRLAAFVASKNTVIGTDPVPVGLVWSAYLLRSSIILSPEEACNLRSVCSVLGFNLKVKWVKDKCKCWLSARRSTYATMKKAHSLGKKPICSGTVRFGKPVYSAQGFLNHNTAADILRIKLCEFYHLLKTDKEFRENVIVGFSVHDEIEFYVKKGYQTEGVKKIVNTMRVVHDNWQVPLEVEPGIGYSWGTCIDGELGPDGKFKSVKDATWYPDKKPDFIEG